ncbi:MAG: hypothetical protein MMC33_003465 [Icmadophila ericetorum]|nr:hypothetical protein [Icmadophila ericetorum]
MCSREQTRSHSGHSHTHNNTYLTSTNKKDAGVRITRIGLYVNLGMAVSKGIGGYYLNSQALIADGFHALTDLVSDFMTLATISVALRPPTSRYPNGYGKVESFGSLMVSGLLLAGGVLMGQSACTSLYSQFFADAMAVGEHVHGLFGHSHSHGAAHLIPNINAAWLAAGSIVVKEWLYRATMKVAKERKSSVLASNAVHHRVDSLTSIVALVAIGGSHIFNGATWLDPVGGLIVSMMVIKAGWSNTGSAVFELMDVGVDDEFKQNVRKVSGKLLSDASFVAADKPFGGSDIEIRDVQGTKAGQNYLMDIELAVPSDWSLEQMRQVEEALRRQLGKKIRGLRKLRVKFIAKNQTQTDLSEDFIGVDVSPRNSPEPEMEEEHHHHEHDHDHEDRPPTENGKTRITK